MKKINSMAAKPSTLHVVAFFPFVITGQGAISSKEYALAHGFI